jgi:hypothetical protein
MQQKPENQTEALIRDNLALCQVIVTLLQRSDELLQSRPWRLGLIAARIERPFRKLILGDRRRFRHLTGGYFHDVAERTAAFRRTWYPATGAYDDAPPINLTSSVRDTIEALWGAVGREREPARDGH